MTDMPLGLDELISFVRNQGESALDQVSAAVRLSEHLGELADHLIGHFVDQARRSGASWTEIGASMGVTKQAAQKRFVPKETDGLDSLMEAFSAKPYSRFTARAKHTLEVASEQARQRRHDFVNTAHLTLGLLQDPAALSARAVEELGVPLDQAREALVAALPAATTTEPVTGSIRHEADVVKALRLTLREALRFGHNYIGTEHMLLGVLHEGEGPGAVTLTGLGITSDRAHEWLTATIQNLNG
jgi:hypothetical protein